MTHQDNNTRTMAQGSVNRFTYGYAITSLVALVAMPLFGWWITGAGGALAALVLVLVGILLTRGLFLSAEHSWVRIVTLCMATVTVSALAFFSGIPVILQTLEGWRAATNCDVEAAWVCHLPALSVPSPAEQWALFLIIVMFAAGLSWLAYKRSVQATQVAFAGSDADATVSLASTLAKLAATPTLSAGEQAALGDGIRQGSIVFTEGARAEVTKMPLSIGTESQEYANLSHMWLQSETDQIWTAPTPPKDFVGRETQLRELVAPIVVGDIGTVCTLHGMGGIGKTTLAALVAQKAAPAFPDGTIWLDLKGIRQTFALSPEEALARVIRRLDRATIVPDDGDDREALFRSILARRKCLIIADDARDSAQVKALIPPGRNVLLVTSRKRLSLDGAIGISVPLLDEADALTLLAQMIAGRTEPMSKADQQAIVSFCGRLPLAVRAAGAFLSANRDWSGQDYVTVLRHRSERFEALASDDLERDVRVVLGLSHDRLLEETPLKAQRWRFLSVVPSHFDVMAAAAIWECGVDDAKQTLSELTRLAMLEYDPVSSRYRFHDLMRDLAEEEFEKRETGSA